MTRDERSREDERIRREFPLIWQHPEIAYLDNSATTQKPACVIESLKGYYEAVSYTHLTLPTICSV